MQERGSIKKCSNKDCSGNKEKVRVFRVRWTNDDGRDCLNTHCMECEAEEDYKQANKSTLDSFAELNQKYLLEKL